MKIQVKNLIKFGMVVMLIIMTCFVMPVFSADFKNNKENFQVKAMGSLFNLAYGGIVEDSEFVYLNGSLLDKSKSEYNIDYGAAIITINKLMRIGDYVSVDYCYVPNTPKTAANNSIASTMPKFQFTSGNSLLDMSLMYNAVDATNGNATYGTNLKTTLGNNFTIDSNFYTSVGEGGKGDFNLHNLSYKNAGLDITMGYQHSSNDFNGMNSITNGSISPEQASILAKEKGLKRIDFGLNYAFNDNSALKLAYNTVEDSTGDIKNTSVAYNNNKLNFNYSTQEIGDFSRFNDIRESNRAALAGEKGMTRNNLALSYDFGLNGGKLSFTQNGVEFNENSIVTNSLVYDSAKIKYNYYSRDVDAAFGNFNGLRDADKGQIAQEAGISRITNSFAIDIGKKDAANWQNYSDLTLETEDGKKLSSKTFDVRYDNFEGQYFTLKSDSDFIKMNALNATERNNFSGFARKLFNYSQGVANVNDADRNSWYTQAGISREMKFFKYTINPEAYLTYTNQSLELENESSLKTTRIDLAGKYKGRDVKFFYYKDDIDRDFNRIGNLTNIERTYYNNMYGMNNLNYGLEGTFDFGYLRWTDNKIEDTINNSAFSRKMFNYVVPKYTLSWTNTKVDDSFTRMGDISDSNRGTYAQWKGFDRNEYVANMKFGSSTKIFDVNTYYMTQNHESLNNKYMQNSVNINYVPDSRFNISYNMNNYTHQNDDNFDIDNKETVIKMNKLLKFGKLDNNSFYAHYRTNSFLNGSSPVEQKFIDLSYKTDPTAKFALNLDYSIANYSEVDKRKGYDLYATQKITDKFGLTLGLGETTFLEGDKEKRIKYGVTYSVNDSFSLAYNIDKITKGDAKSKDNSSIVVQGKLPKLFGDDFINNLSANYRYDLNKSNEIRQAYNDNYSLTANVFKGAFAIERASVLDAQTKSWYNDSYKVSYKNEKLFGSPLSVEYIKDETTNAATHVTGDTTLYKFNYTLNDRLGASYQLTKGGWNNNQIIPIRSEEFALTQKVAADQNISLKYTQNRNPLTLRDERIWSLAFNNGASQQKGKFNIFAGLASSYKIDKGRSTQLIYALEYEYMLSKERFLSILASKTTDIKATNVEDYVTDTFGLDYRQSF
ncbi:MAG: hypothetical protein IJS60_00080 [Abditibacteriota bacterium]|nr:hypothetical protein [Abditibacteriota bacterium]